MKQHGFLPRIALVLAFGSRAGSADAQFQDARSTHARIRQEAHDAPLTMQFVGETADELAAWQKGFGANDRLIDPVWAERALERIGRAYRPAGAVDKLQVDRFDGDHIWNGRLAMPLLESVPTPEK